ncbi:MAG: hypothetical protein KJ749_04710 [Planctomycetes bacterium]|nr:hypothetical protein [Planctomycetota bacterium]
MGGSVYLSAMGVELEMSRNAFAEGQDAATLVRQMQLRFVALWREAYSIYVRARKLFPVPKLGPIPNSNPESCQKVERDLKRLKKWCKQITEWRGPIGRLVLARVLNQMRERGEINTVIEPSKLAYLHVKGGSSDDQPSYSRDAAVIGSEVSSDHRETPDHPAGGRAKRPRLQAETTVLPLQGWDAILTELGLEKTRFNSELIKKLNAERNGPIKWPGTGRKPVVRLSEFKEWIGILLDEGDLEDRKGCNLKATLRELSERGDQRAGDYSMHHRKRAN